MVQENANVSSFIPELSSNRFSEKAVKPIEKKGAEHSFVRSLDSAVKTQNREHKKPAFFPEVAMPRHFEQRQADSEAADIPASPASVGSILGKAAAPERLTETEDGESAEPVESAAFVQKEIDDKVGAMNQSYSNTAVSYPVRRIAREAVDNETKNSLQQQNLWDMPTVVASQPTPQLMAMAQVMEEGKSEVPIQVARPVAQFMASLESELGVKPDRLVQAFRQLPQGSLQAPPEKTMYQVVANLGLNPAGEVKALKLYGEMVAQMQQLEKSEQKPLSLPAVTAGVGLGDLSAKNLPHEDLTNGVQGQKVKVLTNRQIQPLNFKEREAVKQETQVEDELGFSKIPLKKEGQEEAVKSKIGPAAQMNSAVAMEQSPSDQPSSLQKMIHENVRAQAVPQQNLSAQPDSNSEAFNFARQQSHGFQSQMKPEVPVKEFSKKEELHSLKEISPTATQVSSAQSSSDLKNLDSFAPAAATVGEAKSGPEAKHEAIQTIIQNAQMLAQKGGGEMHLTLKPEHLGEIHLRVALDGQKVDVQMMTERSEVKKLIEQSVSDLKHGLASHNLSMDKLNVTLNDRSSGGFQQSRPDFAAARDFAQQFHQQNQSRREMMDFDLAHAGGGSISRTLSGWGNGPVLNRPSRGAGRLDVVA